MADDTQELHAKVINDRRIKSALKDYRWSLADLKAKKINVFTVGSSFYYRENLHSKIIACLIDPQNFPQENGVFLKLFIEFINSLAQHNRKIVYDNYRTGALIEVESDRIDILITSQSGDNAIIIENKINGAGDQPKQLPRYLDKIGRAKVDAIVYLSLDGQSRPSQNGWSDDDARTIDALLVPIGAYCLQDFRGNDFRVNWLSLCKAHCKSLDALSFIHPYLQLLDYIGSENMSMTHAQESLLNAVLKEKDLFNELSDLMKLYNELPMYRARWLAGEFSKYRGPFNNVGVWQNYTVSFYKEKYFSIDIRCDEKNYKVMLWRRDTDDMSSKEETRKLLMKMDRLKSFNDESNNKYFYQDFKFPEQHENLIKYIPGLVNDIMESTQGVAN